MPDAESAGRCMRGNRRCCSAGNGNGHVGEKGAGDIFSKRAAHRTCQHFLRRPCGQTSCPARQKDTKHSTSANRLWRAGNTTRKAGLHRHPGRWPAGRGRAWHAIQSSTGCDSCLPAAPAHPAGRCRLPARAATARLGADPKGITRAGNTASPGTPRTATAARLLCTPPSPPDSRRSVPPRTLPYRGPSRSAAPVGCGIQGRHRV